ncbi:LuxR C-terminal-related transcriptional regulator [Paenibacillus macquariensis]|uniref:LuxR family transcriptional regulator, maltose regulon positive regulatory protein n=1 Tax=Paenibacillus macquariensis TaxID=948756 RepID=A0ABY1JW45_9BACL|nr:LuxR C-terminal-related transcriptional regulator [Paenibacillus macquariensis]MEC0090661.1 LuxR C-terminal-related transcriptional regulator [Paenibacillus macquariensis]OAB34416.1 transcriptional regulator [Paenibacillus macquariensis subsp. macquariensis]SIQ86862.1 LuxR family transcriptional regulator, maltose regulon positive regulatory protein [Paenibacillus macquariensis]
MSNSILSTKLYIPEPRSNVVLRPRLIEHLNDWMHRKLTLVVASAGYGKTSLVREWLAVCSQPVAWLSLEEADNDPVRFLRYFITALQTIAANIGEGLLGLIHSAQSLPVELIITALLNEITSISYHFILVLDDYHAIDALPIDNAISLLLEHMPPQMHLVIVTREVPRLPLARLRVRDQLTEVRTADLSFTFNETAEFLSRVMGLNLSSENITLLESRTEGWIAGLQLAALSMQGHKDPNSFIKSFTGSHHYVLDYLVDEVIQQQSECIQTFLLRTSILDRLCGPLCDAILHNGVVEPIVPSTSGQEILEYLERANLFIIPLDKERGWYRYHHLFAELLRNRLYQSMSSNINDKVRGVTNLHIRASIWHEDNGLGIEAFHHAAVAKDIGRAARIIEGKEMPLHFRGEVFPVVNWLDSLSHEELNAWPSLWVIFASALLMVGKLIGVEQKLQAAETALLGVKQEEKTKDLIGHIAAIRATLAVSNNQAEVIFAESRRALEYLNPDNLPVRTATLWTMGYAYQLQGDRTKAGKSYTEALSASQKIGHVMITIMATLGLGNIQEAENQLYTAFETYWRVLNMTGDLPLLVACEAHQGLAHIYYEWNDLDAALLHGEQSVQLAKRFEHMDRAVEGELFLARLKMIRGETSGASAILAQADHLARKHNFVLLVPKIAAIHVLLLLRQGKLTEAADRTQKYDLPISEARVYLAQGETSAALAVLDPMKEQIEAKGWEDERLKVFILQAVALHAHGEKLKAMQILADVLTKAESGGFIRVFIDEGNAMNRLLCEAATYGDMPDYLSKLLAEMRAEELKSEVQSNPRLVQSANHLIDPLSQRELEVLHLIAQGLSNREISERLFLALSTVKGHNQSIFGKLQVQRRTEAIARARKLGLL